MDLMKRTVQMGLMEQMVPVVLMALVVLMVPTALTALMAQTAHMNVPTHLGKAMVIVTTKITLKLVVLMAAIAALTLTVGTPIARTVNAKYESVLEKCII